MNRIVIKYLVFGLPFLCIVWTILYFLIWETSWLFTQRTDQIRVFQFDPERLDASPALFWLVQPTRLVFAAEYQDVQYERDVEMWVVNLETGQTYWRKAKELPINLLKKTSSINEPIFILPSGERVEMRSTNLFLWLPRYTLLDLGSGRSGFGLEKRYLSRSRLVIRPFLFGPTMVKVSKAKYGESPVIDASRITSISPDQKFIVFDASWRSKDEDNRILVIGPF